MYKLWLKIKYPVILILLVLALAQPLVWLFLIALVMADRSAQHDLVKSEPSSPIVPVQPVSYDIYSTIPNIKQAYLQSSQWRKLAKRIRKRDNYTCQSCGITDTQLEVHHITYERFTTELDTDLITLCRHCHQDVHNRLGYDYRNLFPI